MDVNLIRDKGTGKSKGFAFVAYEDQRSTNLAVGRFAYLRGTCDFSLFFLIDSFLIVSFTVQIT